MGVSLHEGKGLEPVRRSLASLNEDERWWSLPDSLDLGVLAHKMALAYMAAQLDDLDSKRVAISFSEQAIEILRGCEDVEAAQWRAQAEAIHAALEQRGSGASEGMQPSGS